jgi:hypothetical protein
MAIARTARVISTEHPRTGTCIVELEPAEPLGFCGGQYIIVDSGLTLPSGKAAKRAYSILTGDADQRRFRLAVKRIPDGMVSGFMHQLAPGATVSFSGPWGKLGPERAAAPRDGDPGGDGGASADTGDRNGAGLDGGPGVTLVLATDTGISAALGLIQAQRMRPLLASTVLIWLQVDGEEFLPEAVVRARIPAGCGEVRFGALPPIGHPERVPYVRAMLAEEMVRAAARGGLARGYITGDGAVNYALLDELVAAGVPATRDSVESFFNMPKKSA